MMKYLTIITLLVLASTYTIENGVINLTQEDFPGVLQEFPNLFIKFYTPWCGHCKKLAPIYEDLAKQLMSTLPSVRLAQIDCQKYPKIQSLYNVQGFPTLTFLKNSERINFGGAREKDFMNFWLNKKVQDTVILVDADKLPELETNGNVNIVFYGDIHSPQGTNIINVAKTDDYNMYYSVINSNKPKGSVEIFRPFGQTIKQDYVDYNIKSWINLYDRPIVYTLDDRTRSQLFTDKKNGIMFFAPAGELGNVISAAFRDAATEWKIHNKKRLIFVEVIPEQQAYKGFTEHMKVDPAVHPIVFIKSAEKLKHLYVGNPAEITSAKIIEFIKSAEAKKVRKYKMEEETRPASSATATEL